jgi:predicted RecB family nuclease
VAIIERPNLDAYATQRCEVRLQHSFDATLQRMARRAPNEAEQRRIDTGKALELRVCATMAQGLGARFLEISSDERAPAQEETLDALECGVDVIARGWLPDDEDGRRVGRPDLLVKALDGYYPVEVKLHLLTTEGNGILKHSPLELPFPEQARELSGHKFRKGSLWFNDALQLAHYHRMLESLGLAASKDGLLGGVVDGSATLWWIGLEQTQGRSKRRALDAYDERFRERLALVDSTIARNADPLLPRARDPWWHKECERCPYDKLCHQELEQRDDVSLVRWSSPESLAAMKRSGVLTVEHLAGLDLRLIDLGARLAETSMPLPVIVERAREVDPSTPLDELVGRRMGVRRELAAAGLAAGGDLLDRDHLSLALSGTIRDLGRTVRRARALRGGGVLRSVPSDAIDAARAEVEVDIDMESYSHATYLWGATVTLRSEAEGIEEGYVPFVSFEGLDDQREAALFGQFWSWLTELRRRALAQKLSFRCYCFWHLAEEGQMRRAVRIGGPGLPSERELEQFFASDQWVDLHQLCKEQLITEGPLGLKVMATMAGFSWRDEDPSGEASIGWYEAARREGSASARQRLLDYNEDDVRATRALREWLDGPARHLPHVDELDGARPQTG